LPKVEFRKKSRLGKKDIDQIKEKVRDFLERYLEAEQLLNLTVKFTNPIKGFKITSIDDVESAVKKLMLCWNLGLDPIPNVIEMLEENAVRVIEIDAPEQFDGLSTYVGEIPVVVLSKKFTVERKRFTALHELGHLVLNIESGVDKEKACHAFAGAMLLPADALEKRVGSKRSNIARGELVSLKEEFGISLQAIMKRAELKGIIDKNKAQQFWRTISSNKKEEGMGQYSGIERSFRFEHLVFRLAAEEIVSLSKASNLAGMKLAEFREKLDAIN
jgi:Zn-dependent peptidase ImmA (M78 family)